MNALALVMFVLASGAVARPAGALSGEDVAEIRDRNLEYASAWLTGEPEGVMAAFTEDAVLIPALGSPQIEGIEAIRAFYWPPDAAPMTVTAFVMEPLEIWGEVHTGYVRGTLRLSFSVEDDGAAARYGTSGNYLMVFRKGPTGWKIARYIWNHPPWEVEE